MNIIINNFKADLDRLIDNSISITSNEKTDLVNRITEMVFDYDERYVVPENIKISEENQWP